MLAFALVVSMSLHADDTMKNLIKDVKVTSTDTADAGAEAPPPGPNVARMPFTPDSIKTVIKYYQPQIQGCYEETLAAKDKAVEGTLMTKFEINGEGIVKGAKIVKKGTTLKDTRLHACVEAVLSAMTFPKPPDGKNHPIEFPFNLKAIH